MAENRTNFISLLNTSEVAIFSAFDRDYSKFKGEILNDNLFESLGVKNVKKCVFMNQIHSNLVSFVDLKTRNLEPCDALFSSEKNLALCVLSADCLPLLLLYENKIIAAAHSGRAGSFENILKNLVLSIENKFKNIKRDKFKLFISAGICAKNYEISGEVLDFAKRNFGAFVSENKLDLKALIKNQARNLGINEIYDNEICTFETLNLPSFRRDKTSERFVSVIVLKG